MVSASVSEPWRLLEVSGVPSSGHLENMGPSVPLLVLFCSPHVTLLGKIRFLQTVL